MSGQPAGLTAGPRPLLRLLWLARPLRGRLVLSVLAGAAATGCGVALLATSGFLLARAFLRDAPLLLLDEPVAHLDPVSARLIRTAIDTALADRTVILVTHREGWAEGGGRVIRLEQGKRMSPVMASRSAAMLR